VDVTDFRSPTAQTRAALAAAKDTFEVSHVLGREIAFSILWMHTNSNWVHNGG
jgi:hypothetical protein